MNLTSPSQVKAWCIEHDFHPNKTLGQNFLVDRNVLEAIVNAGLSGASPGEAVLEIGPGMGVLTEELLRRGHPVVAIEKDPVLAGELAPRLADSPGAQGLSVVEGDALDVLARGGPEPMPQVMVSNLPYQAGTRILLELVRRRAQRSVTALLQTEVAERLAAKEGGRTRSLSGVWAQLDYDVEIVRKVSPNCFWPRPEIGSAVVRLVRHDRNASLPEDVRRMFHRISKQAFEHRRKQLASIFKNRVSTTRRAEQLSVEEWIGLAKEFDDEKT